MSRSNFTTSGPFIVYDRNPPFSFLVLYSTGKDLALPRLVFVVEKKKKNGSAIAV